VPSVSTTPPAVRRTPPIPAILAVLLGLLSSLAVAFFGVLALAFSNGQFAGGGWLVILVPAVLAVVLVVGVILLLLGRSWLAGGTRRRPRGGARRRRAHRLVGRAARTGG
jgi:protein-S-isoprenylcysteine O-methyltransferase Ste14